MVSRRHCRYSKSVSILNGPSEVWVTIAKNKQNPHGPSCSADAAWPTETWASRASLRPCARRAARTAAAMASSVGGGPFTWGLHALRRSEFGQKMRCPALEIGNARHYHYYCFYCNFDGTSQQRKLLGKYNVLTLDILFFPGKFGLRICLKTVI